MSGGHLTLVESPPSAGLNTGGHHLAGERADYTRHLRRRRLSPNTIEKVDIHLRAFEFWLGRSPLSATAADIEVFLDTRRGRDSDRINDRTRCEWISHLSCFFEWAGRALGEPALNPCDAIDRPRLRRLLPRPISEDDLEVAMERGTGQMRAWLVLGAFAGFRCCEISWLTTDSVMWHEGVVNIFGKGRKERVVPMHELVTEVLRSHAPRGTGPFFRRPDGLTPWTPRNVSNKINAYLADLNIKATAHQLRHRFGTKTYEQCHDILVVKELLGHSSVQTTQVYTLFSQATAKAAVLALPAPNATTEAA